MQSSTATNSIHDSSRLWDEKEAASYLHLSPADQRALKALRSSEEFRRILDASFAEHCAERQRMTKEAEQRSTAARVQANAAQEKMLAAQRWFEAAKNDLRAASESVSEASSTYFWLDHSASARFGRLEIELRKSAHPDLAKMVSFVESIGEDVL